MKQRLFNITLRLLFFVSAAHVHQQFIGDLSLQAVAAETVPPGAMAAGFTTLALNSDFTHQPSKNWLGGCPNGADGSATDTSDDTGHLWWNNIWWQATSARCTVGQTTDPTFGGLVLDIPWASDQGHDIQTASWHYSPSGKGEVHSFPNNAYFEMSARATPIAPNVAYNFITWGPEGIADQSHAGIEWDIIEADNNTARRFYDGAVHNWGAGGATSWVWGVDKMSVDYDPSQYHIFGLRTTSDGTTEVGCGYLDNVLLNCVSLPGGLTDYEKTQRVFLIVSGTCMAANYGGQCPPPTLMRHLYIKSVRVWSCKHWQRTECNRPVMTQAP